MNTPPRRENTANTSMKTVLITLTAAIALTYTANAKDWTWFHGDIGLSSPFVSTKPPANKVANPVAIKRNAFSRSVLAGSKSKSTRQRVAAHPS